MRDLYKAYSAVHDTTIKEELDNSKDQISAMNFGQLTEGDLLEVCEEIVEGLFQYGCDLDTVHEVVGSVMESTVEGELPAHRKEKIVRISEAFDKTFEKVASRAERNCEEEFLKYRTNKPLNEKWQNKLNNEVGNEKLHAALIHEDRETIKGGLIEMISKVIEEKKDSSYLETDMKKREKNNEKARKDMEKVPGQKNPHFEEVSTLRKGWGDAYAAIYEKKLDPVGQEDGDIDNDGDKDSSDKYLAKRRKAIAKSMGKDVKEGKMSDEDVKKRVGYTSDESRQKRLDKIKVKFVKKEETEVKEGIRDLDQEKGTKERKSSLEKKRGMKLDDHPQYKKEEVESEGYMPMTPEREKRVSRQSDKAYAKEVVAARHGKRKEANKQMQRRIAMQDPAGRKASLKNEEEEIKIVNALIESGKFNEDEIQNITEILGAALGGIAGHTMLAPALAKAGAAGALAKAGLAPGIAKAITGKTASAALGSAAGEMIDPTKKQKDKSPVAAAVGGAAGSATAGALKPKGVMAGYEPKGVTFSEAELEAIQSKVDGWDVEEGYQRNPEKGEAEARKSETSGQKAERNVRGRLKTMDPDKAEAMKKQMRAVGLDV